MNGYALERDVRDAIEKHGGKVLSYSVKLLPASRFRGIPARRVFQIEVEA